MAAGLHKRMQHAQNCMGKKTFLKSHIHIFLHASSCKMHLLKSTGISIISMHQHSLYTEIISLKVQNPKNQEKYCMHCFVRQNNTHSRKQLCIYSAGSYAESSTFKPIKIRWHRPASFLTGLQPLEMTLYTVACKD